MKKNLLNGLLLLAIMVLSVSCKKENEDPEISSVTYNGNYEIVVNTTDGDGSISKVEFILDGEVVKTDYSAPYKRYAVCEGTVKYTIKVYDNDGATATTTKTVATPC